MHFEDHGHGNNQRVGLGYDICVLRRDVVAPALPPTVAHAICGDMLKSVWSQVDTIKAGKGPAAVTAKSKTIKTLAELSALMSKKSGANLPEKQQRYHGQMRPANLKFQPLRMVARVKSEQWLCTMNL